MKLFNKKMYATKDEYKDEQEKIIKETMEEIKKDMLNDTQGFGHKFESYEIVSIGSLVEVQCYYHELNSYYNAIGYAVEIKSQFGKDGQMKVEKGFYPIWVAKHSSYAPITFEESYNDYEFINGLGDKATIKRTIRK